MRRVAQVDRARRHRLQDAAFALFAQVLRIADLFRYVAHQAFRLMRIQLIGNENPRAVFVCRDGLGDVVDEIRFGARGTDGWGDLFAGRHFVIGDEALRAVTQVFVLDARTPSRLSRDTGLRRLRRRDAFQGLDAGLFIRTDDMRALRVQCWRGGIKLADGFDLCVELRRIPLRRVEPAFRVPQIKVRLILKNARPWSGKSSAQCRV